MSKKLALILASSLLGSAFSLDAQAFPVLSLAKQVAASYVTPVRSLCGVGFHRNSSGHCVGNGTPSVYAQPTDPPSELVAPLACPYGDFHLFPYSGCFEPACPYGYFLGPHGECFPYWRNNL